MRCIDFRRAKLRLVGTASLSVALATLVMMLAACGSAPRTHSVVGPPESTVSTFVSPSRPAPTPEPTDTVRPIAVPTSTSVQAVTPGTAAYVTSTPEIAAVATLLPAAPPSVTSPPLTATPRAEEQAAEPFDLLSLIQVGRNGAFTLRLTEGQLQTLAREDVRDSFDPAVYNLRVRIKPDGLHLSARLVSLSRSMAIDATSSGMLYVEKGQPRYEMSSSEVQIVCYLCRNFDANGEPAVRVTPGAESALSDEQMIADNRLRWKQLGQGMIQNALWSLSTDPRAKSGLLGREIRLESITLGEGEMTISGRLQ